MDSTTSPSRESPAVPPPGGAGVHGHPAKSPGVRAFGAERALYLLLAVLMVAAYGTTGIELIGRWSDDPNYSHGFLVPAVSYLLYRQRASGVGDEGGRNGREAAWGAGFIAWAMLLRLVTVLVPSLFLDGLSMLLAMAGCVRLIGGEASWRRGRASILFLVFMIPWPAPIYSQIAFPLQQAVCAVAGEILDLMRVPVFREGNLLHLPSETMHVAEACSGLRQLTAFLAIGVCGALLLPRPWWYRWTILASAIPIAVTVNVLRVVGTGLAVENGMLAWTQGVLHDLEGLILVGLGLVLIAAVCRVLDWLGETPTVDGWGPGNAWKHGVGRVSS